MDNEPSLDSQLSLRSSLTDFERTIWSAWIAEMVIQGEDAFAVGEHLALQVGIDYLLRSKKRRLPHTAQMWDDRQEDLPLNEFGKRLRLLSGRDSDGYLSPENATRAYASEKLAEISAQLQSVSLIVQYFLTLRESEFDNISLTRAQYHAGMVKKQGKRTLERHWSLHRSVAHLAFGLCQIYPEPEHLMAPVYVPLRRAKPNDVEQILAAARYAKRELNFRARHSKAALGVIGLVMGMVEPRDFAFSEINPTAMDVFARSEFKFVASSIAPEEVQHVDRQVTCKALSGDVT